MGINGTSQILSLEGSKCESEREIHELEGGKETEAERQSET